MLMALKIELGATTFLEKSSKSWEKDQVQPYNLQKEYSPPNTLISA